MDNRTEGTLSIIAALLVLFSAMVDPQISILLSVIAFAAFTIYKFGFAPKQS